MSDLVSVRHKRRIPILSQGNTTSCIGQAAMGVLGSEPFLDAIPLGNPHRPAGDAEQDERTALKLYEEAARRDPIRLNNGVSSSLGIGRACKALGLISGFFWKNSFDDVLSALARVPLVMGSAWFDSFDCPGPDGIASLPATARIRSGHAYVLDELDTNRRLVGVACSWGQDWGVEGRVYFPFDVLRLLLSLRGEAVWFVPKK